ncbi:cyclin-dependent kinase inhibitor 3-like [Typha latifolia]|uniref:cyclin-dependent kinase inhibitor 3-like n=1 Tax=Typha latifolia TaxID=4733 RepID=UPI003C2BC8A0
MGKFVKKGKDAGEVEVMDFPDQASSLGVRTRAKTLALERLQKTAAAAIDASSFAYLELRSRRLERPFGKARAARRKNPRVKRSPVSTSPRPSSSEVESKPCEAEEGEGNSSLVMPTKEEEVERGLKSEASPEMDGGVEVSFGDNAIELESGRNTRESTPCSLIRVPETIRTPGSSSRPTRSTPKRRGTTAAHKIIPSTQEIEDLFVKREQHHQKVFKEKYNFDPVNDQPLPGRYEWVKIDS